MLAGIFSGTCTVDLQIDDSKGRRCCTVDVQDHRKTKLKVFSVSGKKDNEEDLTGVATVSLPPAGKLDHSGIRVELIGELQIFKDRVPSYCFFSVSKDLEPPGCLYQSQVYPFKFQGAEKVYETYRGENVWLRYYVRVSVQRHYGPCQTKHMDIVVQNPLQSPPVPFPCPPVKMEVGIEDCLHIEFEYDKSYYEVKDVVRGKVNFFLVRLKLKCMQIDVVKTEIVKGASQHYTTTTTTLESIPVRLPLSGYHLTPTYVNVQNKFTVKYYLSIVLIDEEDRRYFKRHDITLYRLDHSSSEPAPPATPPKHICP